MKTTKIMIFGLVFIAISLGLCTNPLFVQKAKASVSDDFMSWPDTPGPFAEGTKCIGGFISYQMVNGKITPVSYKIMLTIHHTPDGLDDPQIYFEISEWWEPTK